MRLRSREDDSDERGSGKGVRNSDPAVPPRGFLCGENDDVTGHGNHHLADLLMLDFFL